MLQVLMVLTGTISRVWWEPSLLGVGSRDRRKEDEHN